MRHLLFQACLAMMVLILALAAPGLAPATKPAPGTEPVNPKWPQKWNYLSLTLSDDANTDKMLEILKQSKEAGCTHIALGDGWMGRLPRLKDADYLKRVAKVRAAAKELNLTLVPMIFALGYGGGTLSYDGNLMAGLPVKDMAFVVKDGKAAPDPADAPGIVNADFEQFEGNKFTAWDATSSEYSGVKWVGQKYPGVTTFVDTEVKHSGKASLRIADLGKVRAAQDGLAIQNLKFKPFQYYRLSCWLKTADMGVSNALLTVNSPDGRSHAIWNLGLTKKQKESKDWVRFSVPFNTLDATEISLQVGARWGKTGTIWIDDVALEPAGMLRIIRRDTALLKVTSEDGQTVYVEGKDFKPVSDPVVTDFPNTGELDDTTPAPVLELTANSAIKDGQKLLVSFYHAYRVDADQDVVTMQDPKVLEIWDQNMAELVKVWPAPGYFIIGYDEIRLAGWEPQPSGEHLTLGQILARHQTASYKIVKKYAPDATVYTWSDMFSPFHNAKQPVYWLCHGGYDKSWEGIPRDLVIMNWYAPKAESVKFFADLGHRQVLCGYYDKTDLPGVKKDVKTWMEVSAGVKDIDGIMYTTWGRRFKFIKDFFELVDTYPQWVNAPAPAPAPAPGTPPAKTP